MTEERVKEIVALNTMENRKVISNFMGEVKDVQKTLQTTQADILTMLKEQNTNSEKWREAIEKKFDELNKKMEPLIEAFTPEVQANLTFTKKLVKVFWTSFKILGLAGATIVAIKTGWDALK